MSQSLFLRSAPLVKPGDTHSALTVTALKFGTVKEAFEEGKRAYAAQKYGDAVKHYTCALEALQMDLSSVIYVHRAAAYEMQNKYELAIEDGEAANPDNNTTCPDPYFAHANALYLNNQLHDAETVYQRGAEAVPKTSPQQNMLAVKHAQVSALKNNQNQHLFQLLPYEVLSRILSQLSVTDRARLGMTCRFWDDYMFRRWPHMWHSVNLQRDFPGFNVDYIAETYLEAIEGNQVRDLYLEFVDPDFDPYVDMYEGDNFDEVSEPEDFGDAILEVMDDEWDAVESLTLKYCDKARFKTLSHIVSESLKTLVLHCSDRNTKFGADIFKTVAKNFPRIQKMTNHFDGENFTLSILDYVKNTACLSNFQITSLYLPRHMNGIDQIYQHMPSLISLKVNSSQINDYATLLAAVYKHCPALEILDYSPNLTGSISATHTQPASTTVGLKTLIIRPPRVFNDKDFNSQLIPMLQKAHRSLQTLSLSLDILESGQFHALDTLAQSGAPHLQTLILEAPQKCSIGSQRILNLISACPSLITISLKGLDFWHDDIFDALANLHQLRKVSIGWLLRDSRVPATTKTQDGLITGQKFETFFKHAETLHEFTYSRPGYVHTPNKDFILQLIKAVSSSNVYILNLFSTRLTTETLPRSLKYLQHSRIRTLKIRIACPIGDRELSELSGIPHLTHLIIYDDENYIDEYKVCTLLDRWQYPQMLVVRVHGKDPSLFIKGYKAGLGTMRQAKEQIIDKMLRYSITSSKSRRSSNLNPSKYITKTIFG